MLRRAFLGAIPAGLCCLAPRIAPAQEESPVTGHAGPGLEQFDGIMQGMMRDHAAPGASLSLAKDGRLVYARGFGWARVESRTPARPETMFGLASVSKSITAVAILKFLDEGRLNLDDRAFGILRDIRPPRGERIAPRAEEITVRQLLNHSGGYKQQPNPEQVSRAFGIPVPKLREDHLIAFFMPRPLAFEPGTDQHYSNFGFTILGAIVERVAGMEYGPAIHRLVLGPMGIRRPRLGHGGSYEPEMARRYDKQGRELPLIDVAGGSAGGWIASTVDMVRFLSALDGSPNGRPFLSPEIQQQMLAPPEPPLKRRGNGAWFGLGWDVVREMPRGPLYAKNGSLPGVKSFIGHMPNGVDWAVVFNGGRDAQGEPNQDQDAFRQIVDAIRQVPRWPEGIPFSEHQGREEAAAPRSIMKACSGNQSFRYLRISS